MVRDRKQREKGALKKRTIDTSVDGKAHRGSGSSTEYACAAPEDGGGPGVQPEMRSNRFAMETVSEGPKERRRE